MLPTRVYEFSDFRLDAAGGVLFHNGERVALTPKAVELLVVLVEAGGKPVAKGELIGKVWADTTVEEGSLTSHVSILRKALGEAGDRGPFIETIPKRGYRFVAPVRVAGNGSPQPEPMSSSPAPGFLSRGWKDIARYLGVSVSAASGPTTRWWYAAGLRRGAILAAILFFLALPAVLYLIWREYRPPQSARRIMLAVLPVENLTGDPQRDYVSVGLTEEIISQLATLNPSRLGVIARTSVMAYQNKRKTVAEIGRELGVDYVLECSLLQWGDRVHISAKLIEVSNQTHVWVEDSEGDPHDIHKMHGDLASAIADKMRFSLTAEQHMRAAAAYPVDPKVHELWLAGRSEWNRRTDASLKNSIDYFVRAIALDHQYAPAYAGLADTYALLPYYGNSSVSDAFPKAKFFAEKALQLDETLPEAHSLLGLIECSYLNAGAAEHDYQRALQLNPNYATAHHWRSFCLWMMNRRKESLAELENARELDPLSLIIYADEALYLAAHHQTDRAIALLKRAIELDPEFAEAHRALAVVYTQKAEMPQAIAEARRAVYLDPNNYSQATLGYVYAKAGETSEAKRMLAELTNSGRRTAVPLVFLAYIYIGLGQKTEALECLERAYRENTLANTLNVADVIYDPIRSDPRFYDLLRRNTVIAASQ